MHLSMRKGEVVARDVSAEPFVKESPAAINASSTTAEARKSEFCRGSVMISMGNHEASEDHRRLSHSAMQEM